MYDVGTELQLICDAYYTGSLPLYSTCVWTAATGIASWSDSDDSYICYSKYSVLSFLAKVAKLSRFS